MYSSYPYIQLYKWQEALTIFMLLSQITAVTRFSSTYCESAWKAKRKSQM